MLTFPQECSNRQTIQITSNESVLPQTQFPMECLLIQLLSGKLQKCIEKVSHFFFHRPGESQQTIARKVRSSCLKPPPKACCVPSISVFKSQMARAKSLSVPGYPMMVSILVGLD